MLTNSPLRAPLQAYEGIPSANLSFPSVVPYLLDLVPDRCLNMLDHAWHNRTCAISGSAVGHVLPDICQTSCLTLMSALLSLSDSSHIPSLETGYHL